MSTRAYKLLRVRSDGSLGSLFIHTGARLPVGEWMDAEEHRTKGYQFRPGWHCMKQPQAPHLSNKGRCWYEVEIEDFRTEERCAKQGGLWFLAKRMKIVRPVEVRDAEAA